MKLVRYGAKGAEKPGLIDKSGQLRDLSAHVKDLNGEAYSPASLAKLAALDPSKLLTLRGRLAWAHDWISDPTLAAVFQTLPGASFIVNGATPAKDSALASAGAELRLPRGVSLLGKFDGEFASHAQTYAGTGTLRVSW